MKNENDIYLSDWLAGKISDNQLKQLVNEEDFLAFLKLKNALNTYEISNPDLEKNFNAITQKYNSKKVVKEPRVISIWKYVTIAASLALFFGLYQVFYFSNIVNTNFGDTKAVILNDNSTVTLNAKSEIKYANLFQYNRTIKLNGEAFFEVQKGSTFTVETLLGKITVLGTKFNVISFNDYFEVVCYEGKVQVNSENKSVILTKGENIRFYDNKIENWVENNTQKPLWIAKESTFKNVPVKYVIDTFKNQYNIAVSYPKNIENVKFTGSFTNTNINTALKTICVPLQLKYSSNSTKIILSE